MLLAGGLSLGTAVDSSGLLITVGNVMDSFLKDSPTFVVLLAFTSLVAVVANFISSTVSAVLLLPVVAAVGQRVGHPRMMVILCAFMTSGTVRVLRLQCVLLGIAHMQLSFVLITCLSCSLSRRRTRCHGVARYACV